MDISTQAVAETTAIHLKSATGEHLYSDGKAVRVVVYGPGSKAYAAIENKQTARAVKRMQDNDGKASVLPPEQRAAEQAEDLAALTVAFENFSYSPAADKQGAELFKAVYADPALGFINEQVLKGIRDWGNFKQGSTVS